MSNLRQYAALDTFNRSIHDKPKVWPRVYVESCLAASWQSGPWEGQRSCGIKGFPFSPQLTDLAWDATRRLRLAILTACRGIDEQGYSRMILARRQSETNANLINQKAPDNGHVFCFLPAPVPFLFRLLRSRNLYPPLDLYSAFASLHLFFSRFITYSSSFIFCLIKEYVRMKDTIEIDAATYLVVFPDCVKFSCMLM